MKISPSSIKTLSKNEKTMKCGSSFTNSATTILHAHSITNPSHSNHKAKPSIPIIRASSSSTEGNQNPTNRRKIVMTFLATSLAVVGLHGNGSGNNIQALAESWGVRSFLWEKFFEPGLSPEDAVARIKQTAQGMHSLREMVDRMAWRYVIFYIRVKQSYLSQDLKTAMSTLPQARWRDYVNTANELVDNMAEFDYFVRTPKVYESYLYYEKALKNLDDIVAMFA